MGNGEYDRLLTNICKRLHERLLTTKDESLPFSTPQSRLPTPDFQDRFIEEEAETGTKRKDASFLSTQHSALRKRSLLERLEPLRVRGEHHCDSVPWLARRCCNQAADQ